MEQNTNTQGLDPEQQQEAAELYNNVNERAVALDSLREAIVDRLVTKDTIGGMYEVTSPAEDVKLAWRQHKVNSATRASIRHYRKNEAAYQEQGLIEATQAGHTIDGWDKDS